MDTKLTLKLDQDLVKKAKRYSKSRETSLSKIVGKFFSTLGTEDPSPDKLEPVIREISGIIEKKPLTTLKKHKISRLADKFK